MSILTKVFVVLVTIAAVVVMGLVISFASNVENYKEQATTARTEKEAAEAIARSYQNALDASQQEQVRALDNLKGEITGLRLQLEQERADNAAKVVEIAAAKADAEKKDAAIARMTTAMEQQSGLLNTNEAELKERRRENAEVKAKNIELVDRIAALQAERDQLDRMLKRTKETVAVRNDQIAQFEKDVADGKWVRADEKGDQPGDADAEVFANPPIYGKVARVKEVGGEIYVELNVGTNDKVVEGLSFMLYRGEDYLGTAIIETTDVNASAGRLRDAAGKEGTIAIGDGAYSGQN